MDYSASTFSMTFSLRRSLANMQTMLVEYQKEISTGRIADAGVTLGSSARMSYILQDKTEETRTILATNRRISIRIETTQNALENLQQTAEAMRATLLVAQDNAGDPRAIASQARNSLALFVSNLNSEDGESFLFGGEKNDTPPIRDYFAATSAPARTALNNAVLDPVTGFGFPVNSPVVANLTAQKISDFIDGPFADLFSETNWKDQWSNASDTQIRNRISLHQTINTSETANDPALRKIAMAYVMVSELGVEGMSDDGARTLFRKATAIIDEGIGLLKRSRAGVGVVQQSIKIADTNLQTYLNILETETSRLEGIDRSEIAVRINDTMTQIEAAYTLTTRISQLSLAKYL